MSIGVDYHPSSQTIALLMRETGECGEQELHHGNGQAEKFYRDLQQRGISVRARVEATGYSRWFERLLAELGFEVWIGDPAAWTCIRKAFRWRSGMLPGSSRWNV